MGQHRCFYCGQLTETIVSEEVFCSYCVSNFLTPAMNSLIIEAVENAKKEKIKQYKALIKATLETIEDWQKLYNTFTTEPPKDEDKQSIVNTIDLCIDEIKEHKKFLAEYQAEILKLENDLFT